MFTSILVGFDGSARGQVALAQAILTGQLFRSRILIAHVVRPEPIGSGIARAIGAKWMERWSGASASESEEVRVTREMVEDAAGAVTRAGLPVETEIRSGDVAEVLHDLAERVGVVVVGRGSGAEGSDPLGPTTRMLIRRALRPVLVAGTATSPMDHCLVAYGGGSLSDQALTFAARFASITDAHLEVVHVCQDPELGRTQLARAAQALSVAPVRFDTHLLTGSLETAIADAVRTLGVNAVFAGAHREEGDQWVASHTEAILRATEIPVLVHTHTITASDRATGAHRRPTLR
jgi:nucleotide-binding universal stress UspA family protein